MQFYSLHSFFFTQEVKWTGKMQKIKEDHDSEKSLVGITGVMQLFKYGNSSYVRLSVMSHSGPSASGGAVQAALFCVRRQGGITETGAGTEPQAAGAAADYCLPKQAGQYCSSAQEEAQLFRISCISAEAHNVIFRFELKECTCGNISGHLSNFHHADQVVSLSLCWLSLQ